MIIIVVAVEAEARAIGAIDGVRIVVAGVGRTNAAAATTQTIIDQWKHGGIDAVISAGIGGTLPNDEPARIGEAIVASSCVYAEEGIVTSQGFAGIAALGFPLGDFPGNAVPVDPDLLDRLSEAFRIAPIATVATCSGTHAAAAEVVRRTGALVEAMEGAAVVHAARRLKAPAIEIRTVSNTTGDRSEQTWDLRAGFEGLGQSVRKAIDLLR